MFLRYEGDTDTSKHQAYACGVPPACSIHKKPEKQVGGYDEEFCRKSQIPKGRPSIFFFDVVVVGVFYYED